MKQLFNWLGKKSKAQPTLGYALLRPVLGKKQSDDAIYNFFKLKNGGRITERAIFLTTCFAAAAALPLAAPVAASTLFLAGAAAVAGKTVGVLAAKVTDFLVEDMNRRVIPRREAKNAAAQKPQP